MKTAGFTILIIFYGIYIGKMLLQKRKGIQTDQMGKGKADGKVTRIERMLKAATYSVVAVEVVSIMTAPSRPPQAAALAGAAIGFLGDILFALSVLTMKDSWRAGIAENERTEMVTNGIYGISRNPAFLAFDCVYVGLLLMFFNGVLLLFSVFAMVMLHLQILQEERHLERMFGTDYLNYKKRVCRYLGRKR